MWHSAFSANSVSAEVLEIKNIAQKHANRTIQTIQ